MTAAVRQVFICPPAAARGVFPNEPQFLNRYRRSKMVSADTKLSFSDTHFMHVYVKGEGRKQRRRFIPDWAHSNASFRAVVRLAAEKYIGLGLIPADLPLEKLMEACRWRTRGVELRARWVENERKRAEMLQHVGSCRR